MEGYYTVTDKVPWTICVKIGRTVSVEEALDLKLVEETGEQNRGRNTIVDVESSSESTLSGITPR